MKYNFLPVADDAQLCTSQKILNSKEICLGSDIFSFLKRTNTSIFNEEGCTRKKKYIVHLNNRIKSRTHSHSLR